MKPPIIGPIAYLYENLRLLYIYTAPVHIDIFAKNLKILYLIREHFQNGLLKVIAMAILVYS